jgi:hypothetical protein
MPPEIHLLSLIGLTLLQVQTTEHIIKLCMTYVLQQEPLTLQLLEAQEEKERHKTLGYFLQELRKRAAISPGFDEALREFLTDRNIFAHDLKEIPGWDLKTDEGRRVAIQWLSGFYARTSHVLKVFSGLVMLWQKQTGYSDWTDDEHPFFKEVEENYTILARLTFAAKD